MGVPRAGGARSVGGGVIPRPPSRGEKRRRGGGGDARFGRRRGRRAAGQPPSRPPPFQGEGAQPGGRANDPRRRTGRRTAAPSLPPSLGDYIERSHPPVIVLAMRPRRRRQGPGLWTSRPEFALRDNALRRMEVRNRGRLAGRNSGREWPGTAIVTFRYNPPSLLSSPLQGGGRVGGSRAPAARGRWAAGLSPPAPFQGGRKEGGAAGATRALAGVAGGGRRVNPPPDLPPEGGKSAAGGTRERPRRRTGRRTAAPSLLPPSFLPPGRGGGEKTARAASPVAGRVSRTSGSGEVPWSRNSRGSWIVTVEAGSR